jgi:hypothetical protein
MHPDHPPNPRNGGGGEFPPPRGAAASGARTLGCLGRPKQPRSPLYRNRSSRSFTPQVVSCVAQHGDRPTPCGQNQNPDRRGKEVATTSKESCTMGEGSRSTQMFLAKHKPQQLNYIHATTPPSMVHDVRHNCMGPYFFLYMDGPTVTSKGPPLL